MMVRRRPSSQIWVLFNLESPAHTSSYGHLGRGVINWTATYRTDSTIVTPYERFTLYRNFTGQLPDHPQRNFAAGPRVALPQLVGLFLVAFYRVAENVQFIFVDFTSSVQRRLGLHPCLGLSCCFALSRQRVYQELQYT